MKMNIESRLPAKIPALPSATHHLRHRQPRFGPLLLSTIYLCIACSSGGDSAKDDGGEVSGTCPRGIDKSVDLASAIPLTTGKDISGQICPVGDRDFYRIQVPSEHTLVRIKAQHGAPVPRPNFELRYLIRSADGKTIPAPQGLVNNINALHCVDPGTYTLEVEDRGGDTSDGTNTYRVSYETAADLDTHEPNNAADLATRLLSENGSDEATISGRISCAGDIDFYRVTVAEADRLMRIRLSTTQASAVDLRYQLYRSDNNVLQELASGQNDNGAAGATALETVVALTGPGTYLIAISDLGDDDGDTDIPYALTIATPQEPDSNDRGKRNDHPGDGVREATPIGSYSATPCAKPKVITVTGTLASRADVDYLKIDGPTEIDADTPPIMDISLAFEKDTRIDPVLSLLFKSEADSCSSDKCCRVLDSESASPCSGGLDCSDSSFSCVRKRADACEDSECTPNPLASCTAQKWCAGASLCLPESRCAARQFGRTSNEGAAIHTAQPMVHPGPWYIRIADEGADDFDLDTTYTLKVRICTAPDDKELDTGYFPARIIAPNTAPILQTGEISSGDLRDFLGSKEIVTPGPTVPRAPNFGEWMTGHISYEHDEDLFSFPNPCPNAECMLGAEVKIEKEPGGECPTGSGGSGLGFHFLIDKGEDGADDFITADGVTGTTQQGYLAANKRCSILLRAASAKTLTMRVSDLFHNAWSPSCRYSVRFQIAFQGCPEDVCARGSKEQGQKEVCFVPR